MKHITTRTKLTIVVIISLSKWVQLLSWIYIWNHYSDLSHFGKQAIFIEWFHLNWINEQIGLYQFSLYQFPFLLLNFVLTVSLVSKHKTVLSILLLVQASVLMLMAGWGLL